MKRNQIETTSSTYASEDTFRSPPFISRHAIDRPAQIGSYYDLNEDRIINNHVRFHKILTQTHNFLECNISRPPFETPLNFLKLLKFDPAQRLSITTQIQSARHMAAVHKYIQPINQYTRILHHLCISESDHLANEEMDDLIKNKHRLKGLPSGTHIIFRINYGIEAVVILKLPKDDQLISRIDHSLDRIRRYFEDKRLPQWSKKELDDLKTIRSTKIYSNMSSLTSLTSITNLQQAIHHLIAQTQKHQPCTYDLCPVEHLFFVDNQDYIRFYEVSATVSQAIEQYILEVNHDFDIRWFMSQSCPNCDKYHPTYSFKEMDRQWKVLQQLFEDEVKRIQAWVMNFRTGGVTGSKRSSSPLDDDQVQRFRKQISEFRKKLKGRQMKEAFIRDILNRGSEYRLPGDYDIMQEDDDQALEDKFQTMGNNRRIVCGTDHLWRDHPAEWTKICDELEEEGRRNDRLEVRYVDFTNHAYKLHRFKVFPMKENKEMRSDPHSPLTRSQDDDIVNVLLLGESGVGKSTFINALVNYLRYNTYQEAETKKPIILLPVSFLVTTGKAFDEVRVEYDGLDTGSSEDHDHPGQSVTQHCRSYIFTIHGNEKRKLRLIDTPGFGDSRGIEQDQHNMQEILWFINNLSHLHAICLLMRPNVTKLHPFFRSCLSQIFDLIGKHSRDNLLFCFTNACTTFFVPSNTALILDEFLRKLSLPNLSLKKTNTFCFDSESFRYLVTTQYGVKLDSTEADACRDSWTQSSKEAKRLIDHVLTLENVHNVQSIDRSRKRRKLDVLLMIRPMLETIRNDLRNIILCESRRSPDTWIELRPKHLSDYMAVCHQCPSPPQSLGYFAIRPDHVHVFHIRCLNCTCATRDHTMIHYRLEYKVSKSRSPQSIDDMKTRVNDLICASAILSYFLLDGIYNSKDDRILTGMKRMIEEEKKNGETLSESSPLNAVLVEKLEETVKRYESVINLMMREKESANDMPYIDEWIKQVHQFDVIQSQMDAAHKTVKLMSLASEFHVNFWDE